MAGKQEKKCNCEDDDNKDMMNYVLLGGIAIVIYLVMTKKC
jgi:hypothetical protein